jgi:hypothetical protein
MASVSGSNSGLASTAQINNFPSTSRRITRCRDRSYGPEIVGRPIASRASPFSILLTAL